MVNLMKINDSSTTVSCQIIKVKVTTLLRLKNYWCSIVLLFKYVDNWVLNMAEIQDCFNSRARQRMSKLFSSMYLNFVNLA